MLAFQLHTSGGPFIALRDQGVVWSSSRRLWLPFVRGCTGHCIVIDFLPFLAKSTVASRWSHGTPDSPVAHRIVRWGLLTVGLAHVAANDRARPLARARTIGLLAHRTVRCTPDNLVNYSQCARLFSWERPVRLAGQPRHRTLSGAHQTVWYSSDWRKFGQT
jgi:hypothetical protein